jgi:hypothetical protein
MDLAKLKGRAQEAARKVAESDQAMAARQLTAAQVAKLGPHLREVIDLDDDRPVTPEALLLRIVAAVHDDDEVELSFKDLRGAGKRNERLTAAAGIVGGGIGCVIADLYAEAALYWMLADCFDLDLSEREVAAHLLVAWGALPDPAMAHAVMDPEHEATIAGEACRRFQSEATVILTKRGSVATLWRLRSGLGRIPIFDPSTLHDVFFAGRALQQRLDTAALQLGLSKEDVRKPSLFRRRRR